MMGEAFCFRPLEERMCQRAGAGCSRDFESFKGSPLRLTFFFLKSKGMSSPSNSALPGGAPAASTAKQAKRRARGTAETQTR